MSKTTLLLLLLILLPVFSPTTSISIHDNTYVYGVVSWYNQLFSEYRLNGSLVYTLLDKAVEYANTDPGKAINTLSKALLQDTDNDGIPDLVELYDGLNPYSMMSSGQYDMIYMAFRSPVIDGYIGEWKYIKHYTFTITSSGDEPNYYGTSPKKIMITHNSTSYILAVEFNDPPASLYSVDYTVLLITSNGLYNASIVKVYYNGLEAVLPYYEGSLSFKLVIDIPSIQYSREYYVNVSSNNIPSLSIKYDEFDKYIKPLIEWYQPIPKNLPWYPIIVFGDNRPKDMGAVKFDEPFYSLLDQLRIINPEIIIGTGDHVGLGRRDQIDELLKVMAGFSNPWLVAGNHDWSYVKAGADRDYWEKMIIPNLMVRDDIPGWRIIFINGYALEAKDIDMSKIKHIVKRSNVINAITNAGSRKIILVFHVPPIDEGYGYPTVFSRDQMTFIRSIIKQYSDKIKLILCGHWHVWRRELYFGVDMVITGGGGAPLSSKGGIRAYHYTALILKPDGTYELWSVQTHSGEIKVYEDKLGSNTWVITIRNTKRDVYGSPVDIPVRIVKSLKGIDVAVYLRVPNGVYHVYIKRSGSTVTVSSDAGIEQWFVYSMSKVYTPVNNKVFFNIPVVEELPDLASKVIEVNKTISLTLQPRINATVTYILGSSEYSYSSEFKTYSSDTMYGFAHIPADDEYNVTVYVIDSEKVQYYYTTLTIDLYPPVIEILKLPYAVSRDVNATIKAYDLSLAWISVYIDDKLVANKTCSNDKSLVFTIPIHIEDLGEGPHSVKVIACDKAGHKTSTVKDFLVDLYPPQIVINAPSLVAVGEEAELSITVNDPSFDYGEIYVNGTFKYLFRDPSVRLSFSIIDVVLPGTYNITVVAHDKAGNVNSKSIIVKIVTEKPSSTTTTLPSPTQTTRQTTTSTQTTAQQQAGYSQYYMLAVILIIAIIAIVAILLYKKK